MICNFNKSDLEGIRTSSTDCPVCRFLKRVLKIEYLTVGNIFARIKGIEYSVKNYSFQTQLVEGTSNNIEIVGLELDPLYWCIPITPELKKMFEKILSKKIYKRYNNGKYKNTHFMKVQRTEKIGFYSTHPKYGINLYPIASIDFILKELEKLPNKERLLSLNDLKPGDIAEILKCVEDPDRVGEIVYTVLNHESEKTEVYTLQWNGIKSDNSTEYCGPWWGECEVKLLKTLTITR